MRLVERDEQLRCLSDVLAESAAGRGAVVSLEAPASCGRTALLDAFTRRAREHGALVLTATCSATEQDLPFAALSQLLHHPRVPGELADLPEVALPPDAVTPELARILHAVWRALLVLATEQPVVLAVDNVASADQASRLCLLHLAARLGSARVLVAITDDVEPSRRHLGFRAELSRHAHFRRLRFGPLSRGGVEALLTARWDESTVADRIAEVFRISGGNPLLVRALADDYEAAGTARRDGYGLAVLSWLHRGEPAATDVVRGLAVLGEDTSTAELATLLRASPDTVDQALGALTTAGLLEKGRLPHPVARDAVLDALPAADRAELHRRAARVRHEHGGPLSSVADHLLEAGRGPAPDQDEEWVVDVLLDAADSAAAEGDLARAVACLSRAHDACRDDHRRILVLARLADVEWQSNPLTTAATCLTRLVEGASSGVLGSREQLVVIRYLLWHGRHDEADEVLAEVRASDANGVDGQLADFETWLTLAHPRMARRHRPVSAPRDRLTEVTADDPWLRVTAAMSELVAAGRSRDAADSAERCLSGLRFRQRSCWSEEAAALALQILAGVDRLDTAARWCHRLLAEASADAVTWRATITSALADIALRTGDLVGAVTHGRAALALLPPKAWGVTVGAPLSSIVLAATRKGEYAVAADHVRQPVPSALFESRHGPRYLYARGHYHLAVNHGHRALADFLSCGELLRGWGLDLTSMVPWRTSAAEAWLHLGNHDQARQLAYEQTARSDAGNPRTRALSLRMLAATSPADRRPELLTEALELLEQCGDRYEQAQVLTDLSHGHHVLGENRRARMVFRRAWHLAEVTGAALLLQKLLRADEHPAVSPTPPPLATRRCADTTALTASEHRVASLAVLGCSNREIAAKLHITVSTVEQHLTRIYRKLNIKRRRDLPVELGVGIL
ncbi:helix-turn-helix transcriptional regulator [Actinoalloteichus caeruleus]|uniref:Regulatory protein, luxR family n=3 Tax=Actinoalloteichus cyanogriseus TaxID=2893586 RepID=A0ABT1JDP0_ACTCY|nr:LuxR family transcriptional regulator [Actinoalloteichus caeruleus]MCP2330617.1 regulatory protein, luxR family [Actinoalloteichus caeruleus DSM 43889]